MRKRPRRPTFRPTIDQLEDRRVLSAYGNPWPDPTHLTLSFAPDGTNDAGQASALFQTLNSVAPTSTWESTIIRAYQTWASYANINLSLTNDNGNAFGTPGAIQGDSRFGDIRIGAISQSPGVLAVTQPFSDDAGTWAGDVNFNTADILSLNGSSNTEDLYTLALHEAGHSLGLADNSNSSSIMNTNYQGTRTGLGPSDIAAIQALYGLRPADTTSNANSWTPTWINPANPNGSDINASSVVASDTLATTSDQHHYAFNVTIPGAYTVNVTTAAASSALTRVTAYNQFGAVIGQAVATDPTIGNLSLALPDLGWGSYHFTVQAASANAFGVGSYAVRVLPSALGSPGGPSSSDSYFNGLVNVGNNTIGLALPLLPRVTSLGTDLFTSHGSLSSGTSADYDRIVTPGSGPNVMTVSLARLDSSGLDPVVTVLDAWGNAVASEVTQSQTGLEVVQVLKASYNTTYNLKITAKVSSGTGSTGNFNLDVDFSSVVETPNLTSSGTLTPTNTGFNPQWSGATPTTLTTSLNGMVYFDLQTSTSSTDHVDLFILDSSGNLVSLISAIAGQSSSLDLWLGQGTYTLYVTAVATSPSNPTLVNWTLNTEQLSTPMLSIGYSGGGSSTTTYPPGQKTPATPPALNSNS